MKKILVIDDEKLISHMIRVVFKDEGYNVTGFSNSQGGEDEAIKNSYDLILLDINMPGKNGAEVTKNILKAKPDSKIIIITAFSGEILSQDAIAYGAESVIAKPLTLEKILNFINTNNMAGRQQVACSPMRPGRK